MVANYVPEAGDVMWMSFDPQAGRERSGRRPFLVLSPSAYNAKTSLAVGVPITSRRKRYPFEVDVVAGGGIEGVALADQVKSHDWRARRAAFAERASSATVDRVKELIAALLDLK